MKKKLGDLTVSEFVKIKEKCISTNIRCVDCQLSNINDCTFINVDKWDLDQEIEVPDER